MSDMKLSEKIAEDTWSMTNEEWAADARALEERVAECRASELEGWALARDNAYRAEAAEAERDALRAKLQKVRALLARGPKYWAHVDEFIAILDDSND